MNNLPPTFARQAGAATLTVVLILLFGMTIIALTTSRTGMVEQQITGNDMRAREAFESSEAGIEYGIAYLTNNNNAQYHQLNWASAPLSPSAASDDISQGEFTYSAAVTYERTPSTSNYIKIISAANETSDNSISATNEQYVKAVTILNGGPNFNVPPFLMDGCLSDVTGNPDVYIGSRADGVAAGTSQSPANQGAWGDGSDADNPCLKQGHLNAHGGQPIGSLFPPGHLWEYVFGNYTREQIKAKAAKEVADGVPASERTYYWVTDPGNFHDSLGSQEHPVILVFDAVADCPKINGNPTIYGLVFVDSPCEGANGWGGTTIYGTAIINGNTSKLTANSVIHDWSDSGNSQNLGNLFIDGIYKVPGTWKDF